jgi:hypothetical protein
MLPGNYRQLALPDTKMRVVYSSADGLWTADGIWTGQHSEENALPPSTGAPRRNGDWWFF